MAIIPLARVAFLKFASCEKRQNLNPTMIISLPIRSSWVIKHIVGEKVVAY